MEICCKERIVASSWHHTGKYFQETNHYSIYDIAEEILELKDTLNDEYKTYLKEERERKSEMRNNFKYGFIEVQVCGGTRKHPRITGYNTAAGIIIDGWLFYIMSSYGCIRRYSVYANKVVTLHEYDTYNELIKEYIELRGNRYIEIFDRLLKEKKCTDSSIQKSNNSL